MNSFDFDPAWAMDPCVQSMPEAYQRRLVMLWCFAAAGLRIREADLPSALTITADELAGTKAEFMERGFIDEAWNPLDERFREATRKRSASAERQARFKAKKRAEAEARGVTGNGVGNGVGNAPGNGVGNALVTPGNAMVTPVTPGNASPPTPPPIKSLTLESLVQTDTHTSSSGVCVTEVTHGPDHDLRKTSPACSPEEVADLMAQVSLHFDPLCLSDVWGRHIRAWSVTYPADWIARAIPLIARKAATDKYLGEPWGHAILEKWALAGGPPVAKVYAEPYGPPGESPPGGGGGGASRPPSEFRRRQESLKEFARQKRKEIEDEEAAEEMGRADHDRSRNAAGTRGSRGGVG